MKKNFIILLLGIWLLSPFAANAATFASEVFIKSASIGSEIEWKLSCGFVSVAGKDVFVYYDSNILEYVDTEYQGPGQVTKVEPGTLKITSVSYSTLILKFKVISSPSTGITNLRFNYDLFDVKDDITIVQQKPCPVCKTCPICEKCKECPNVEAKECPKQVECPVCEKTTCPTYKQDNTALYFSLGANVLLLGSTLILAFCNKK